MRPNSYVRVLLAIGFLMPTIFPQSSLACCAVYPTGKPVVNADQTVVLIWDPVTKTEHFIRKATFKSDADDFGFLIPSPSQPTLAEAGDAAFPFLQTLTEPKILTAPRPSRGMGCGCGITAESFSAGKSAVTVLQQKEVAGFDAVVLEADSADGLAAWLQEHGFSFSPEVADWAKPYIELGWKITALKVAKDNSSDEPKRSVAAAALRLTFQTERPLFPYREPDSTASAQALGAKARLLRIYFLSDARYRGELTKDVAWTGKVAWANKLSVETCQKSRELLQLPPTTTGGTWWLTEFEDQWPYRVAPADVYFSADNKQETVEREPIIHYTSSPLPNDVTFYALLAVVLLPRWYYRKSDQRVRL